MTSPLGNRTHTVTTSDRDLAFAIFEAALELDNEPEFTPKRAGAFVIAFVSDDNEAAAAIESARNAAARGLVGVA